eukprot:UN24801
MLERNTMLSLANAAWIFIFVAFFDALLWKNGLVYELMWDVYIPKAIFAAQDIGEMPRNFSPLAGFFLFHNCAPFFPNWRENYSLAAAARRIVVLYSACACFLTTVLCFINFRRFSSNNFGECLFRACFITP